MLCTPAKKLANFSFRVNSVNNVLTATPFPKVAINNIKTMHIFPMNRTRVQSTDTVQNILRGS